MRVKAAEQLDLAERRRKKAKAEEREVRAQAAKAAKAREAEEAARLQELESRPEGGGGGGEQRGEGDTGASEVAPPKGQPKGGKKLWARRSKPKLAPAEEGELVDEEQPLVPPAPKV